MVVACESTLFRSSTGTLSQELCRESHPLGAEIARAGYGGRMPTSKIIARVAD
jgi:hypothetical protein